MTEIDLGLYEKMEKFRKDFGAKNPLGLTDAATESIPLKLGQNLSGVKLASEKLKNEMPVRLEQTLRIARKIIERMGVADFPGVYFNPSAEIIARDKAYDLKSSGLYYEFSQQGIDTGEILFTESLYSFASDNKRIFLSMEHYAGPFFEELNATAEQTSLGAISVFSSTLKLTLTTSANQVDLSHDHSVIDEFVEAATESVKTKSSTMGDPDRFVEAADEINNKLKSEEGLKVVGVGAQVVLVKDGLTYYTKNADNESKILNFILAQGIEEFIKRMSSECSWFIAPKDMSDESRILVENNLAAAPSLDEVRNILPGISAKQVVYAYLSSQIAKAEFTRLYGDPSPKNDANIINSSDVGLNSNGALIDTSGVQVSEAAHIVLPKREKKVKNKKNKRRNKVTKKKKISLAAIPVKLENKSPIRQKSVDVVIQEVVSKQAESAVEERILFIKEDEVIYKPDVQVGAPEDVGEATSTSEVQAVEKSTDIIKQNITPSFEKPNEKRSRSGRNRNRGGMVQDTKQNQPEMIRIGNSYIQLPAVDREARERKIEEQRRQIAVDERKRMEEEQQKIREAEEAKALEDALAQGEIESAVLGVESQAEEIQPVEAGFMIKDILYQVENDLSTLAENAPKRKKGKGEKGQGNIIGQTSEPVRRSTKARNSRGRNIQNYEDFEDEDGSSSQ